jgi:hypothetical protein
MINSVSKPKIPKDYKYILKTNQLEEILTKNKFSIHIDLNYWLPQEIGTILEAHYWLPNSNIPYNRLYIRAGALPNKDVRNAQEELITTVFPAFIKWLNFILKLPSNSSHFNESPYFNAIYKNNKVEFISNSF